MIEQESLKKAQAWAQNPYFDPESRQEIKQLLDKNDTKEIIERFYKDLEFGTGGIRSILGMGDNRINKYTIRKASQALANAILATQTPNPKMCISYDSRKFSLEFAKETASVMAANGIKAYIFNRLNPVCLLSFAVRHKQAQAGVMVTASHNPPEYNGYKVYWSDGAQVTPPYDQHVIQAYYAINSWDAISWMDFEEGVKSKNIEWIGQEVEDAYFAKIETKFVNQDLCRQRGNELKIIYTPIHGTGKIPCERVLNLLGTKNFTTVPQQAGPDEKFPTVKSPNPENPDALAMAVDLLKKQKADIAFGTDPDTDRLGVALIKNGQVFYPNGNQIGILMLHYILTNLKEQNLLPKNPYFVKTIVTSPLQEVIASKFGVSIENTLTGFKWICGRMGKIEKEQPDRRFVFATEESFGYMNHNFVRDKDGVSSLALMAEIALWYKIQGMDLLDGLDKIYEEYGFSDETLLTLTYQGKEGGEKIARIMERFRNRKEQQICGEKVLVIEDYQSKERFDLKTHKKTPIDLPESNVLGHIFESGSRLYLRPSGTEPKIKFYIMIQEAVGSLSEKKLKAETKKQAFLNFLNREASEA